MTYLEIARRGKTAAWRYGLCFVLGLVLTVVLSVAALLPLMMLHLTPPDLAQQLQHPGDPAVFFLFTGLSFALLLVSFAAAIGLMHRKRFMDIVGVWRWRGMRDGAAVWALVLVVSTVIDLMLAPKGFAFTATAKTPVLIAWAVPTLALQTFAEEFVFRGYVTQGLMLATKRPVIAALLSGLVFGAMHIPNGAPQAASAVVFGVALALIAIRTRGIAFGYGMHLINNVAGATVLVSGGDVFKGSAGLFTQTTPNLMWWDVFVEVVALALVAWRVLSKPAEVSR
ncbi:MAG TPA: CPBP family intramembrane glutamic endopeptidase [Caulobacteraceae bacterium]|nr:CPBP family intramembrane glutamic endopeptidase [Caulobacteraceae bacterium]